MTARWKISMGFYINLRQVPKTKTMPVSVGPQYFRSGKEKAPGGPSASLRAYLSESGVSRLFPGAAYAIASYSGSVRNSGYSGVSDILSKMLAAWS